MNVQELRRLAFGFRAARALFAGVEMGLFEALGETDRTLGSLSADLGADERGLRILIDALVSLDVLERVGSAGVRIAPSLREVLMPGGEEYLGNLFLHDLWHWTSWSDLDESVRTGSARKSSSNDRHLGDPEVLRRFLPNYNLAMEQSSADSSQRLAEVLAKRSPRSVLDLGGGTGGLLVAVCRRLPEARGLLVEHEFVLAQARERIFEAGLQDRVDLLALDIEKEAIPTGYDAVVLSRVLMGMTPTRARALVLRAGDALRPGACLCLHDFDSESYTGALLSLDMLLNTGGEVHPPSVVNGWLEECGLALEESRKLLPYTRYWIGTKP